MLLSPRGYMFCSVYSADKESAASKPLRDLKGYTSLATVLTMVKDRPLLLFYTVDKHRHSHARPLPAIRAQIWLILAHIPQWTPLLCHSLHHCEHTEYRGNCASTGKLHCGLSSSSSWPIWRIGKHMKHIQSSTVEVATAKLTREVWEEIKLKTCLPLELVTRRVLYAHFFIVLLNNLPELEEIQHSRHQKTFVFQRWIYYHTVHAYAQTAQAARRLRAPGQRCSSVSVWTSYWPA